MASSTKPIPKPILATDAVVRNLGKILLHFDPDSFEKASTKYRKPSYQRALDKKPLWNRTLVESVLTGRAIGAITMSKWADMFKTEDGDDAYEEYYNIEDGGTRLGALYKFFKGEFSTVYGDINDPAIKQIFMDYQLTVSLIDKANPRIKNSAYFKELCQNFGLLQEGTALTASDRYCAVVADHRHNFKGSPIVNKTISNLNEDYKNYFGWYEVGPRDKNRKKLASAVALFSGITLGPEYANESFYNHLPILFDEISDNQKTRFKHIKKLLFNTIKNCSDILPKWPNEQFRAYFNKIKMFTGLMIADVFAEFPIEDEILMNDKWRSFSTAFTTRWSKLINTYRRKIKAGDKNIADEWLNSEVYTGLGAGQKRNSKKNDLIVKMKKVRAWVATT